MSLSSLCTSAAADSIIVRREATSILNEISRIGAVSRADILMARQAFAGVSVSSPAVRELLVSAFGSDVFEATPAVPALPTLRDLADPQLPANKSSLVYRALGGQLIVDGATADDIRQGGLGDCFVLAALQAYALAHPGELEQRLTDNGDGTVTFAFRSGRYVKQQDATWAWEVRDLPVTVDKQLPTKVDGSLAFGRSATADEQWVSLIEKAYAELWRNMKGYVELDKGGSPSMVLRHLDGHQYKEASTVAALTPEALETLIKSSLDAHLPLAAGTLDVETEDMRANRVLAHHAYAVVDCRRENDQVMVELMNPWGRRDRQSAEGEGGRFWLPLSAFMKCYESVLV